MKKVIVYLLTLIAIALLAGCSSNNEVSELRQEVENLKTELSQIKEQLSELPPNATSGSQTSEAEPTESETTTKAVSSDMLDYLTLQLQSGNYEDWNAVASCEYATEEHLLTAAIKCATIAKEIPAKKVATSICENPSATGKVIKELSDANWYSVWNIAAQSIYADEEALIALAKECATIREEQWAETLATSICQNPAATGKVIKELSNALWFSVWNIAAQSAYADEEALIALAIKCSTIAEKNSAETIATSICQNSAATGKAIKELANANWYSVWNIAAQSAHADEEALIALAKACVTIYDESWIEKITISICENPATTGNVLKELASSNSTAANAIAHAKLEER